MQSSIRSREMPPRVIRMLDRSILIFVGWCVRNAFHSHTLNAFSDHPAQYTTPFPGS